MDPRTDAAPRWARQKTKDLLGTFLVGALGVPAVAGIIGAFLSLPEGSSPGERAIRGVWIAAASFLVILLLVFAYSMMRAPYLQRDALRYEIDEHFRKEHSQQKLIINLSGPSAFRPWKPAPGRPTWLMTKIDVPLIVNETEHPWSLQFELDGTVEGVGSHMRINKDAWRRMASASPEAAGPYLNNPMRVESGADLQGELAFLTPFDEDLRDKRLLNPRLAVMNVLTETGQWIFALPPNEHQRIEKRWEHPGFGSWDDLQ